MASVSIPIYCKKKPLCSSSYFLSQGFPLNLELPGSPGLADQLLRSACLCPLVVEEAVVTETSCHSGPHADTASASHTEPSPQPFHNLSIEL